MYVHEAIWTDEIKMEEKIGEEEEPGRGGDSDKKKGKRDTEREREKTGGDENPLGGSDDADGKGYLLSCKGDAGEGSRQLTSRRCRANPETS